jgi:hypothetical protein
MIASTPQDARNHISKPLAYPLAFPSSFSLQHVKYESPKTNPPLASVNDTLAPQPPVVTPRDVRPTIELSASSFSHVKLPEVASETGKGVIAQVSSDDGNGMYRCTVHHLTRS